MSFVASLDNRTPVDAKHLLLPDGDGGEALLVVVKAAFDITADGTPALAQTPAEIRMADAWAGPPERAWPIGDADLALYKPRVDVLIHDAVAHAPKARATQRCFVELHVGFPGGPASDAAAHDARQAQLIKSLAVTGDRVWQDDTPSDPLPFVRMPIGWTRAYGGTRSPTEINEHNPLGIGWKDARSSDREVLSELPNLEDPGAPMHRRDSACTPVGFGVIARAWLPRRALAGSFDAEWTRSRWPLAPRDHDPGFQQAAAADQQLERYVGGEPVRLVNLTPEGEWLFRLPRLDLPMHLLFETHVELARPRIDTVEIDPQQRRVTLTGRLTYPIVRGGPRLVQIVIGHLKPGWLRARAAGKCYLDLRQEGGSDPRRPWFG
jgi:hypothetical protein